ncbi:sigma-E factor negative regulatory protein [Nitrosomonas sp. Nm166]|uniref:sigma-E factor negative regulatory protein n=1 Tax=Nitrosomonas sp. Nm166 TaxID=1881054 RepID=UPI0008EBADA8|nr:sigma-E factor negative regulatory protein [Nitrosomonas sp. Nm166]SFE65707.1 sigma-E factor negative regulatory protein RseA [Nitrosomonas sp. Nm166]
MKSKVSALMDGELDKQETPNVIEALRKNEEWRQEWETYHLIGDALRQSSRLSMNISSSVNQKLKTEPTVLFPKASINTSNVFKQPKHRIFAFSMAASVIAMVSAWVIMHNPFYEPQQTKIAENPPNLPQENNLKNVVPVMVSSPPSNYSPGEINDYLFVHREFSSGTHMRGQPTNIKNNAAEYDERYGSR